MGTYPHPTDRPHDPPSDASTPDVDEPRIPKPPPQKDRKRPLAGMLVLLVAIAVIIVLILI
jgi:hypothetical protein